MQIWDKLKKPRKDLSLSCCLVNMIYCYFTKNSQFTKAISHKISKIWSKILFRRTAVTQPAFASSKSTGETPKQCA